MHGSLPGINQAEPNARMFEPPQGYRIVPMDGQ